MSRRFDRVSGGHMHAAWETQPLIREGVRQRAHPVSLILSAFILGLLLGMLL